MFYLKLILHGADTGQDVALEAGQEYIFGRGADCSVQLSERPGISRSHFRVFERDGHWQVEVLSKFGSIIHNGLPVQSLTLDENTVFELADYDFKFYQKAEEQPAQNFEPLPMASGQSEAMPAAPTASSPPALANSTRSLVPVAPMSFEGNAEATRVVTLDTSVGAPYVRTIEPSGKEFVLQLSGQKWIAGRDALCEILLNDRKASRRQFELTSTPQGYFIRDLGSANGTLLNGMALAADELKPLRSGDTIQVGGVIVHFELRDPNFERKLMVIAPEVLAPPQLPAVQHPSYEMINYPVPMDGGAIRHEAYGGAHPYSAYENPWEGSQTITHGGRAKKIRFALFVIAVGMGCAAYLNQGAPTHKEATVKHVGTNSTINEAFSHLSVQKQKQVKEDYILAKNLFLQNKYDMAFGQLEKIHELLPEGYEDSRDMRDTILEQRRLQEAKEQNDKELARAEENKRIIAQNLRDCEQLAKTTTNEADLRSCLSPTIQRDPGNQTVSDMITRVQNRVAQNFKNKEEHDRYVSAVAAGRNMYQKAEAIERSGDVYRSIDAYHKFLASKFPDPEGLKSKAQQRLAAIQHELSSKAESSLQEAESAYASKNYKAAISGIKKVKEIDPSNQRAAELNAKIRAELEVQLKEMWQEAVLLESFGDVPGAQKKWKQILDLDHPDGVFYKRAKGKMRAYGGS